MKHLIETDLKVCSENLEAESADDPLVDRLKVSKKMLLEGSSGSLGQWIGILYATTALYAVTLHTSKVKLCIIRIFVQAHNVELFCAVLLLASSVIPRKQQERLASFYTFAPQGQLFFLPILDQAY